MFNPFRSDLISSFYTRFCIKSYTYQYIYVFKGVQPTYFFSVSVPLIRTPFVVINWPTTSSLFFIGTSFLYFLYTFWCSLRKPFTFLSKIFFFDTNSHSLSLRIILFPSLYRKLEPETFQINRKILSRCHNPLQSILSFLFVSVKKSLWTVSYSCQ